MARRRRSSFGSAAITLLGLLVALWLSGRAPWSSANSPTADTPATQAPSPTAPTTDAPTTNPPSKDAPAERAPRIPTVAVDPQSVWASPAACERAVDEIVATPRTDALRVASWNLHWFPDARSDQPSKAGGTDVAWMACAMASLRADVIAVQEVLTNLPGRSALSRLLTQLDRHTRGHWQSYLDTCPADRRQHVGFLYDTTRVQLDQLRDVPELNPHGSACAKRLRPGVAGRLTYRQLSLQLVTLHFDSGDEQRDYQHRLQSVRRLTELFSHDPQMPVLALGDFNTMGCERCASPVSVDQEVAELEQTLRARDYRPVTPTAEQPICSHHFEGRAHLLDRAITTLPSTDVLKAHSQVAGLCAELACQRPRTTSEALERLSDHCPIVVEFTP